MPTEREEGPYRRIIRAMRTISTYRGQWFGVSDLAERMNLSPSTVHNMLQALIDTDIVEYEELTRKYRALSGQKKRQDNI